MFAATDYPFLDILWTMIIFFVWLIWIWTVISILADVFARRDISGWGKAAWTVFLIAVPFLGVLIYMITNSDDMAERRVQKYEAAQARFDDYAKSQATNGGGAAVEIEKAKQLLDSGAITQAEFEAIKVKALA
jgi:hypothetical protein